MTDTRPAVAGAPVAATPARRPSPPRRSIHAGEGRLALYLIAPTLALLALVVGYPVVSAIVASFQKDQGLDPATGLFNSGGGSAGVSNYKQWLLEQCPSISGGNVHCPPGTLFSQFWSSLWVTVGFTVVSVAIETAIGLAMALMMHKAFRGRGVVRAAILVPWAIPTAVTAKLWTVIYDPNGILNHILGTHFQWTSETWPARAAVVFADVWKTTPFMALLILAGLQGISADLYESAMVDGANAWQRFQRITLPLLKPAIAVALIFRTLDVLRIYDLPWILTHGANGTSTLSILVVQQLRGTKVNSAAALSTITFVFIFAIAFAMVRVLGANVTGAQRPPRKKRRRGGVAPLPVQAGQAA